MNCAVSLLRLERGYPEGLLWNVRLVSELVQSKILHSDLPYLQPSSMLFRFLEQYNCFQLRSNRMAVLEVNHKWKFNQYRYAISLREANTPGPMYHTHNQFLQAANSRPSTALHRYAKP